MDDPARTRDRLADVRRRLAERPDDPELEAQERRLSNALEILENQARWHAFGRWARGMLAGWHRRN